jgi:uncharacterized protein YbaR (Trm112 family)
MAVDPELLAILACPACETRPPVALCPLETAAAAQVVEKYRDKFRDEEPVVTNGLHCAACGRVYPIVSDIPVMLVEEALPAGARAS